MKSEKKDTNLFILLFQTRIDAFFIVHNVLDQNCIELFFLLFWLLSLFELFVWIYSIELYLLIQFF